MDFFSSAIDVLKKKVVFNSEDLWLAIWQLSDFQTMPEFVKAKKNVTNFGVLFNKYCNLNLIPLGFGMAALVAPCSCTFVGFTAIIL